MNYKQAAENRKLIQKLKKDLKKQEEYKEMCEKYYKPIDFVDDIKITFEPLDVSAKTINGEEIILNERLLDDKYTEILKYLIHEIQHCGQSAAGKVKETPSKEDYLDDKNEQEAFRAQISFQSRHEDPEEVQEYIENLLDHHDIKGKERQEKIKILTKDL